MKEEEETMLLRLWLFATLLLFPMTVQAGDMPKEGTDSVTNTWMITSATTLKVGDHSLTIIELSGITRNDAGGPMFNNMGFHCIGTTEITGSAEHGQGACTWTDKDKDQVLDNYESKGGGVGHSTIVAGSGKFAGISGTSEWTVQFPIPADDKFNRGIGSEKIHWKLQ
jgi:hypothetical protein